MTLAARRLCPGSGRAIGVGSKLTGLAVLGIAITGLAACDGPRSPRGFRLPDGDADTGREVFVTLQCHSCHEIEGLELPPPVLPGPVKVALGGDVTRIKTYGELVTSIINPSHELAPGYADVEVTAGGRSLMPVYNRVMSVQQLVDLVAFLQPRYRVVAPTYEYPTYHYPGR